jgi:uncharacterized membrane protein YccC
MATDPPEIIFVPEPDSLEREVRIGCGSVFGIVIGFGAGLHWWPTPLGIGVLIVVGVITCAWLALKHGDRFWTEMVGKWLPWW